MPGENPVLPDKGRRYLMTIYRDARGTDYKTTSAGFKCRRDWLNQSSVSRISLSAGGGVALSLVPIDGKPEKTLKKYKD